MNILSDISTTRTDLMKTRVAIRKAMKQIGIFLLLLFTATLSSAQSIPVVKARALDDSEVTLPSSGQQNLILVVGFSRKSGELCRAWAKKISADYGADSHITYFVIPVLQGAPSLVRPMILHGMRKSVPFHELPHFVPLYSNESDWKKIVNFSAPDDAYLIVAAPDGRIVWQAHGVYSDAMYADLKKSVGTLPEESPRLHRRTSLRRLAAALTSGGQGNFRRLRHQILLEWRVLGALCVNGSDRNGCE